MRGSMFNIWWGSAVDDCYKFACEVIDTNLKKNEVTGKDVPTIPVFWRNNRHDTNKFCIRLCSDAGTFLTFNVPF